METWQPYSVITRNVSVHAENKIHDDAEARRYGFKGGLVPGTAVYAHMTRPLVARYGEAWLTRNESELSLKNPAYEGDKLCVTAQDTSPGSEYVHSLAIANADGQELATLATRLPPSLPPPDPLNTKVPAPAGPRIPISWDAIVVGQPLQAMPWDPTPEMQQEWCTGVSDDLAIYRGASAPVHPGLYLQAANYVLRSHFVLKPWIHVGSRVRTRELIRVGQKLTVHAVPIERWEKKGHQFWKVYVTLMLAGRPLVEIWHTAIFSVRPVA